MSRVAIPHTHPLNRLGGLHPDVARLHADARCSVGRGWVTVRRGSAAASALASALRLPEAGETMPCAIAICRDGGGELWRRSFNGVPLITQVAYGDDLLVERVHGAKLSFAAAETGGSLVLHLDKVSIGWRGARWSVPRCGGLSVVATVDPGHSSGNVRVAVVVSHVWLDLLVAYAGLLVVEEAP